MDLDPGNSSFRDSGCLDPLTEAESWMDQGSPKDRYWAPIRPYFMVSTKGSHGMIWILGEAGREEIESCRDREKKNTPHRGKLGSEDS